MPSHTIPRYNLRNEPFSRSLSPQATSILHAYLPIHGINDTDAFATCGRETDLGSKRQFAAQPRDAYPPCQWHPPAATDRVVPEFRHARRTHSPSPRAGDIPTSAKRVERLLTPAPWKCA